MQAKKLSIIVPVYNEGASIVSLLEGGYDLTGLADSVAVALL